MTPGEDPDEEIQRASREKVFAFLFFGILLLVVVGLSEAIGEFDWAGGLALGGAWVIVGVYEHLRMRSRIRRARIRHARERRWRDGRP